VYRYFSLVLVVFNAICLPFWNATTDAYTRNDLAWIHQAGRKLNMIVGAAFVLLALMVLIAPPVYRLWVGSEVQIPAGLSASMALYIFILIASFRFSYILNGINVLRIQLVFTLFATIVFIPLAWLACKHGGSTTWLVLAMCAVQCPGLIANMWKCHQVFRQKQT
jgi:O-antigen/teichoic acid export membrane protein